MLRGENVQLGGPRTEFNTACYSVLKDKLTVNAYSITTGIILTM